MPELKTADGRYLFADQGDGNAVVYDLERVIPVWDRWAYEGSILGWVTVPTTPPEPPVIPPTLAPGVPIQVTNASDGVLIPRLYSYWSNAVRIGDDVVLFVGHASGQVRFFRVNLHDHAVDRLGALVAYDGTGEGWYWDRHGWVYLCAGARLHRVSPFSGEDQIVFDITETHPGCDLWQAHSSEDGRVHCATVRRIVNDGAYPKIGTVVCRDGRQEFFPAQGSLDESAITADGTFLIIKEDDDNRIINLETRETRRLTDAEGAVGHSDCGNSFVVGEDNIHGACVLWDLRQPMTPERRRELFKSWNVGHLAVRGNRCLLSDDNFISLVALDGSGVTPLVAHGQTVTDYDSQVQATLTPDGSVACWMANGTIYLMPL